ncbi:MAG TPA: carboxylesterase family protein [Candidatus Bathyarchaeia archaeon]|nr:carboxylesterase family protein [Candidatus Bathyarchaeia archaeon]
MARTLRLVFFSTWAALLTYALPPGIQAEEDPLVRHTVYGDVAGLAVETAIEDEPIETYVWLGVPFAKPPVGELRWRAPQPPEPWAGVRQAKTYCEPCTQYGGLMAMMDCGNIGEIIGGEDCLYLNVWRPRTQEENLPVFFWIHGGANCVGQAAMPLYNGSNFAGKSNVVFVSINYRMGPLGWFTHPALRKGNPLDASGNYGTLDIVRALEWVRDNIAVFGGDPHNVTIAGESAGGVNVFSMLASPLAAGLFHRAISQSGAPFGNAFEKTDRKTGDILIQLVREEGLATTEASAQSYLDDKDDAWISAYLRSKTAAEILACYKPGPLGNIHDFTPVFVDGTVLPINPSSALRQGKYNQVPVLLGSNAEELKLFLPFKMSKLTEAELCQLIKEMDPNAPSLRLADQLKPSKWPLYHALGILGGAGFQWAGVDLPAHSMRKHQDGVYAYRFDWANEPKPFDFLIGAGHALEMPFVFGNFHSDQDSILRFAWSDANRSERKALSSVMMSCWANFARTGGIADAINGDGFRVFAVRGSVDWWRTVWALGSLIAAINICAVFLLLRYLKDVTWPTLFMAIACGAFAVGLIIGLTYGITGVALFTFTCLCASGLALPCAALWNRSESKLLPAVGIALSVAGACLVFAGLSLGCRNPGYWAPTLAVYGLAAAVTVIATLLLILQSLTSRWRRKSNPLNT